ncbi:hypothetical protein SBA5_70061 [Candidatus Sulfotelmatomonas gaucii]|uniref:Uncharacterized protein n=1 Tax=Candidatus Sulfuritelmatomonas gaucii TaxID=2043161 RepID=A0A2N9M0G2_9BACT|nr:hypothetical protein SBA5_70061 [Candidatus Sulfotelmatomonas gaucii]
MRFAADQSAGCQDGKLKVYPFALAVRPFRFLLHSTPF